MNDRPCGKCGSTDRLPPPANCQNGPCRSCSRAAKAAWARAKYRRNPKDGAAHVAQLRAKDPRATMFRDARTRAHKKGLPFNIEETDIVIPEICPVFGVRLVKSDMQSRNPAAPSLDRIVPGLGYVKGNVRVISLRANILKNNAVPEEIRMLHEDMLRLVACSFKKEC